MKVLVLNGPNLNMLGVRQPETYGTTTLDELEKDLHRWGESQGVVIEARQSNHEGELVDAIQGSSHDGIVLNPGALTHTSRAIADAIRSVGIPTVEVHISNIREREPWRAVSMVSEVCVRTIYGRGVAGYRHALRHLINHFEHPYQTVRYGPHTDNVGDLRRGERGLVVLVHGGFWRHQWERDTTETLAVDLARQGFNTWNIEYRRLGRGGGWPGSAHDLQTALDFVPQLGVDHEPVTVIGHSAGAVLSLWAAPRSRVRVSGVVALAPITQLGTHGRSGLDGAEEARMLLESGAPDVVRPAEHVLVVQGEDDRQVPLEHSSGLAGEPGVEVLTVPGGHFELLDPGWAHWDRSVAFLKAASDLSELSTDE